MKRIHLNLTYLFLLIVAVFIACSNDDDNDQVELTEQDIADVIAASLSNEDGGLASDITNLVEERSEECGYVESETFTDSQTSDDRSYIVDYEFSIEVICDENEVFQRVDYEYTAYREAQLIRLDVISVLDSNWELYNDNGNFILNGSYNYSGDEKFKVREANTLTSNISYSSTNLSVNEGGDVLNGELSFSYDTEIGSNDWSYSGVLSVTSTNLAEMDITNFEYLYIINLETGEVTQKDR